MEVGSRPEDVVLCGALMLKVEVLERLGGSCLCHGQRVQGADAAPCHERFCAVLDGDAPVVEAETVAIGVASEAAHVFDGSGKMMRRLLAPEVAE